MNTSNTTNTGRNNLTCSGGSIHVVYLSIILTIGSTSNIILLYANYKEWKKRRSPDKVLIFNIVMFNTINLMLGVPLRLVSVARHTDLVNCIGNVHIIRGVELSFFVFVNFGILSVFTALAFDRYEALTKFASQRTLSLKKTYFILVLVWMFCLAAAIGYFVTYPSQCIPPNLKLSSRQKIYRLVKIIFGLLSAGIYLQRCVHYLYLTSKTIREQRERINEMFGVRRASSEISFTKSVVALLLCYLFSLVPLCISATIAMFSSNQVRLSWNCAVLWTRTNAYLSSVLIPIVYFGIDKRLLRNLNTRINSATPNDKSTPT